MSTTESVMTTSVDTSSRRSNAQTSPIRPSTAMGTNSSGNGVATIPGEEVSPTRPSTGFHFMSVVRSWRTPRMSNGTAQECGEGKTEPPGGQDRL